jgi:phytoene dehydrogenase-like protein
MPPDVIVCGGGLGGLSAAAYLLQQGVKVTLIEAQPRVGGYAIAFKRDDFIFDVALHAIPAGQPGQPFHQLISELGLSDKVRFLKLKEAFRVKLGTFEFIIPNDFEDFFVELIRHFPADAEGLVRLRNDLLKYASLYFQTMENNPGLWHITSRFIPRIPTFLKHTRISTRVYLDQFVSDPTCKAILYQAAVFFGIPMKQFPAINFLIMFYLLFTTGMHTIQGGGQALTDALLEKITQKGGEVITGRPVDRIILNKNKAVAVRLRDGSERAAAAFVSNINTPYLAQHLIGESNLPMTYVKALRQLRPSLSILQMHLGLDCRVQDLGITRHISIIFPDEDMDRAMEKQNSSTQLEGFSILAPGINDPRPQAQNERVLSVVGGVSADAWLNLNEDKYRQLKQQSSEHILAMIEREYPGIKKHIRTIDLATPHTFRRYTENPNGAILGFDTSVGMHRTIMKISRFPIKNVFLANAWTSKLGGFMQCMKAGMSAGERVLKYLQ